MFKLNNDPRLIKGAEKLRKYSIDEIPQFINVLKGEMSIVGPRPHMVEHDIKYSKLFKTFLKRHKCSPGLTGWAQVNGRNSISWKEKFIKDVWYVNNKSFYLDLKIIFITIKKVILRHDINKNNHITSEKFNGRN